MSADISPLTLQPSLKLSYWNFNSEREVVSEIQTVHEKFRYNISYVSVNRRWLNHRIDHIWTETFAGAWFILYFNRIDSTNVICGIFTSPHIFSLLFIGVVRSSEF